MLPPSGTLMEQISDRGYCSGAQDVQKKHVFISPLLKTSLRTVEGTSLENLPKIQGLGVGWQVWVFCYYTHSAKMCLTNLNLVFLSYTARAIIAEEKKITQYGNTFFSCLTFLHFY